VIAIAGLLGAVVLVVVIIATRPTSCDEVRPEACRSTSLPLAGERWSARHELARDLARCQALDGKTTAQVKALLGAPQSAKGRKRVRWIYGTGPAPPPLSGTPFLEVTFTDGRVTSTTAFDPS
jgi:hypothetical protein